MKSYKGWCAEHNGKLILDLFSTRKEFVKSMILDDYVVRSWYGAKADGWRIRRVKVKRV